MHGLHKFLLLHLLASLGRRAHGSEIINGEKVPDNSMLYMASVQRPGRHICGGFLVSEDFVITAAHCDDSNPTRVVLGTHNLQSRNHDIRDIIEKCKPPSYVDIAYGNDIMLLKLSRKVQLGNRVQPVQLPSQQISLKENEICHVAGWGLNRTGGKVVNELQGVDVPIMTREQCQRHWNNHLPEGVICAGGYGTNKGFCQGDSGGPLVCSGMAVGVVSFNKYRNCDYPDVPNVYTDVAKHLPWIKKILKQKHC